MARYRLGAPISATELAPGTRLFRFTAQLSEEGWERVLDFCDCTDEVTLLRLTPGEAFGLLLASWREIAGPQIGGEPKPYGGAVAALARSSARQR